MNTLLIRQRSAKVIGKSDQILFFLLAFTLFFPVSVKAENDELNIDFSFSDDNFCSGTSVSFIPTVSGGKGILKYEWNFGGKGASTEEKPSFKFEASAGCDSETTNVTLTVTDDNNKPKSVTKPIKIKQLPDVDFLDANNENDPFNNCLNAGNNPIFEITVGQKRSSTCVSSYNVDWGDGTPATNVSFPLNHTYDRLGAFKLKITSTASNGCNMEKEYVVKNQTFPAGGIYCPETAPECAPTSEINMTITGWSVNSPGTTYNIDYGDNTSVFFTQEEMDTSIHKEEENYPIPYSYKKTSCPGSSIYTARITIVNSCNTRNGAIETATVMTPPKADFIASSNICVNTPTSFTNKTIEGYGINCNQATSYAWDFGDGTTSTSKNETHTYSIPGVYTVKLTAEGVNCGISEKELTITVKEASMDAVSDVEFCNGEQTPVINFSSPVDETTYSWDINYTPNIGLRPAYGNGSIPSFIAKNTDTTPISSEITVTPKLDGCPGPPQTFKITVNPSPDVIFSEKDQTICSGQETKDVTLSSSSQSSVSFEWTATQPDGVSGVSTQGTGTIPIQTLINETNTSKKITYTAKVLSSVEGGCNGVDFPYTITVNPVATISDSSAVVCSGEQFRLTPNGNTNNNIIPSLTKYDWSEPEMETGISGGEASTASQNYISGTLFNASTAPKTAIYTVTPVSGTCNGKDFKVTVTVNPKPSIANQTAEICSGGSFTVLPTDGDENIIPTGTTYTWTNPVSSPVNAVAGGSASAVPQQTISQTLTNRTKNDATLTYTVTPSSSSDGNCKGSPFNVTVTVKAAPSGVIEGGKTECKDAEKVEITLIGDNGTAPYEFIYTINDGSPDTVLSTDNTATLSAPTDVIGDFTYKLIKVSDASANSCEQQLELSTTVEIVEPAVISKQPETTQEICSNGEIEPLTVEYANGAGTPSYQWYKNTSNSNIGGSPIQGATNNQYAPPASDFSSTGKYYYYVVISFDGSSCENISSNAAEVDVTADPPSISLESSEEQKVCQDAAVQELKAEVTGGIGNSYSYQWYDNSGKIAGAVSGTYTPSSAVVGTQNYYVEVSQSSVGCSAISPKAKVEVIAGPKISQQPQSSDVCEGEDANLLKAEYSNGTGTASYQWYENSTPDYNGTPIAGANTNNYAPLTDKVKTTYYYAEITFSEGGCGSIQSEIAEVTVKPYPEISDKKQVAVSGYPFSITPENNGIDIVPAETAYTWKLLNSTGAISGMTNQPIAQPSVSMTLTNDTEEFVVANFLVTANSSGCESTFNLEVTIYPPLNIEPVISHIDCAGNDNGKIEITDIQGGLPPYTITWLGPNGFSASNVTVINNLKKGEYKLTISDSKGQTFEIVYEITEPAPLYVNISKKQDISCDDTQHGQIQIVATGGTNPTFEWTKDGVFFSNEPNLFYLDAGEYKVVMTDENNCEPAIDFTEIIQPVAPEISLISQQDILCYGQETGSIFIDIANDKPATDYNITWTGTNGYSSTQQNIDNLPAGTYNVNVIGEHCVKNAEFTLTQPEEIMLNSTLTPVSCYDGNDATATLNISGGLAPYTVVWEDDFSGFFRNNLSAGIQNIHITDFNNCEKTISLAIPEAPVFRIMPEVSPVTCYESNDAAINLNLIGGEEPVLLTWQDNGSSQTIRNNLAPGTYAVQITDGKGCQIDSVFTFAEPLPLTISETVSNNDCQNENSGSIEITVAGGTSPYQYLWSNNKTVQNLHNIPPGDYRVDVEDSNGCAISKEFTITKPLPVHLEFNAGQRFDCVTLLGSQIITAEATGGIPPYKKEWRIDNVKVSEEDSFIVSSNNQVVELKVTDRQGCFAQEVFQPEIPEYGIQTEMINCNEKNYRLSVVSTNLLGNKITDSYEWEFGDNQSKTGRSSEDYQYMESGKYEISVTVTDLDICPEPYTFKRNLVVNDPPAIHIDPRGRELQQDTFYFCEGETVILDAEGGMEYSWGTDSLLVSEEGNQTVIGYAQPDASIDKPSNKCQSVATVVGAFKDVTYKIKPPATNLLTSKNKEVEFSVEEILDDTKSAKWWVVGEEYNSSPGFDWIHEFSVEKDGEYTVCVEVENNDGCSDTNCVTLYVDKFFDELPNTFIADGENRFMKGWYIQILNRNHVLIYEGDEGWDGTFRNEGTPVSQDTYHYYIKDYEEFGVNRKYCYLTVFIKR